MNDERTPASVGKDRREYRTDLLWAAAAGVIAFAVYLRTLAPGPTFDVDTAMFQFLGRVLGVGHNPGYPLFVFLTHPVSLIPAGTLAWRINLFSAGCGAVAAALVFLLARRLGCVRPLSLTAAFGFALGSIVWSQAVIAEVYALNACLFAGVLLALLAWRQTRQPWLFYLACALVAAGLGHHMTILALAPGLAVYAIASDRRFALRPRTLAAVTALMAAGLLQYAFILLRSSDPGAYVESRATTLSELAAAVSGTQFRDRLFAFDWPTLLSVRGPAFLTQFLAPELTWAGLILAAAGASWLLWRRRAEAMLLLSAAGAVLAFALIYDVIDSAVFIIPALMILWLLAAVGAERLVRRRLGAAAPLAAALSLLLPLWLVTSNFAHADRSDDTEATLFLDRLFDVLPSPSRIVKQDFLADRLVSYKLLGEGFGLRRGIELLPQNAEAVRRHVTTGTMVVAFGQTAKRLRHEGLDFSFAPLTLLEGPLTDVLGRLTRGTVVALAVPPGHVRRFAASVASLKTIVGPRGVEALERDRVIVGVRGGRWLARREAGSRWMSATDAAGALPHGVDVRVDGTHAAIRQDGRELVRSSRGAVLAIWNAAGRLLRTSVLEAGNAFLVPLPAGRLAVHRLLGEWPSVPVAAGRVTDLTSITSTGSILLRVPRGDCVAVDVGGSQPFGPGLIDASGRARVSIVPLVVDGQRTPAAERLETELATLRHVVRIELDASEGAAVSASFGLGAIPVRAVGRVRTPAHGPVLASRVEIAHLLRQPDRATRTLTMTRDEQSQLVGQGWSAVEVDRSGAYRRMVGPIARLVFPLPAGPARVIRAQLRHAAGEREARLALRLNGDELAQHVLADGWQAYEWPVPEDAPAGPAEIDLVIERPTPAEPEDGVALGDVSVELGR